MLLFIDESGTFQAPQSRPTGVSCTAGLMFPHRRYRHLQSGFDALKRSWGVDPATEVKASRMDEAQVASVIDLLLANRATCCGIVYDPGLAADAVVTAHKLEQAKRISQRIGRRHSLEIRRHFIDRRRQLRVMPNQLYVQAKALVSLCEECLQMMLIEYPQTHPSELGNIEVMVDAKDSNITPFEDFWKFAILPELQARSVRNPSGMANWIDYSHFNRAYRGKSDRVPPHLADLYPDVTGPFEYTSLGRIFQDIQIRPSHLHTGLQLADVVANTLTRVLKGNLQPSGWHRFPRLFVRKNPGSLTLIMFEKPSARTEPVYQAQVVAIHRGARPSAVHRFGVKPRS